MAADQAVEDGPFESFLFQHRGLLHGVPSGVIYVTAASRNNDVHRSNAIAHPSIASNDPENHLDFLNDQDHADEQAGRDPR